MSSGFVWRVKGVYTQPDDGAESFFSPGVERHFECLVITHDPQAHDVPALAFEMRIGEQEHWERYNAQVTSMQLLGWAQGSREATAMSTEPPKVELWSKTAPWDSVSWMAKLSWKVSAQEVAECADAVIVALETELTTLKTDRFLLFEIERYARMAVEGGIDESAKGWLGLKDMLDKWTAEKGDDR